MESFPQIDVYFDGGCPICRWEVDLYARMDRKGAICWTDIETLTDETLPIGKTRQELLGKFHVREIGETETIGTSDWHIGVDAFTRIWKSLPRLRRAAFIFRLPIIRQAAMLSYRLFLKWQSWHRQHRRAN